MQCSAYCPINYVINRKIKVQRNNMGLKFLTSFFIIFNWWFRPCLFINKETILQFPVLPECFSANVEIKMCKHYRRKTGPFNKTNMQENLRQNLWCRLELWREVIEVRFTPSCTSHSRSSSLHFSLIQTFLYKRWLWKVFKALFNC